ncbi:uncharacterized protein LOC134303517 [Trichomycterus rosablanca]
MVRLPSGESLRVCFPSNALLSDVVDHVTSLRPSLPAFSLLHGFPRRSFSERELCDSLFSLGLSPNAALVLQIRTPPADSNTDPVHTDPPVQNSAVELNPPAASPLFPQQHRDEAAAEEAIIDPPAESPHVWGRGHRLIPEDEEDEEQAVLVPPFPLFNEMRDENQHHWPDHGNRLRGDEDPVGGARLPGDAALQRLQRVDLHPSPPHRSDPLPQHSKTYRVPKLVTMATSAAVFLITAPCKQYVSSFSGLTPELAERLLDHLISERVLSARTLQLFVGCSIRKLMLNSYPYTTNTLLQQLASFTHLTHLNLANSALITDKGLSVLSMLVKLQYLNLSFCSKLTGSCLHPMTHLKCLSGLLMDGTKLDDDGLLMYLHSSPPALSHLSLNHTSITEVTLSALSVCVPHLRLLSITHTQVCDVSALVNVRELHTLHLDFTRVPAESLQFLSRHPNLSSLSLLGLPVTYHALHRLSGLKLTRLTLPGPQSVSDAGLSFLSSHTHLSEVDLSNYTHITDHGIAHLTHLTRLKKLSLSNTGISDDGLSALFSLTQLSDLCLNRTAVTSRGVAQLITHTPYIQVLGLSCTQVGDSVLKPFIRCTELIKLNLSKTRITDRGLKFLYGSNLTQVNLDGTGVTAGGVANLISASPCLIIIRANQTQPLPPELQSDDDDDNQMLH